MAVCSDGSISTSWNAPPLHGWTDPMVSLARAESYSTNALPNRGFATSEVTRSHQNDAISGYDRPGKNEARRSSEQSHLHYVPSSRGGMSSHGYAHPQLHPTLEPRVWPELATVTQPWPPHTADGNNSEYPYSCSASHMAGVQENSQYHASEYDGYDGQFNKFDPSLHAPPPPASTSTMALMAQITWTSPVEPAAGTSEVGWFANPALYEDGGFDYA